MLWSTQYLSELALEAEIEIAKEVPAIIDRYSLAIEAGISEYELPDYITNITRVFWKGMRLDPVSHLEIGNWIYVWDKSTFGPFAQPPYQDSAFDIDNIIGATPQGKPYRYFYSKLGENVIKFNPAPNESVAEFDDLYKVNIPNAVIIEFYRQPDGVTWKLPKYIRRRTIKAYVMWKAYACEGDGQDLSASQYFHGRYLVNLARAKKIIGNINSAIINSRDLNSTDYYRSDNDYGYQGSYRKARPVLPSNFGVNLGYGDDF